MTLTHESDHGKKENSRSTTLSLGYHNHEESLLHRNVYISKVVGTVDTFVYPRGIQFLLLEDCHGISITSLSPFDRSSSFASRQ